MSNHSILKGGRIPFLDNIRTLMVVLVLIFHACASYSSAVDFWPYHEKVTSGILDFYMLIGDVFIMSILFFIAGYFAMPSYNKRGGSGFLKEKFKTLGIPWLVITIFVLPIIDYINYLYHLPLGMIKESFGSYWLASMEKILEFNFGFLDMSTYIGIPDQFYQRYMWFLSLLLFYFVVFAIFMRIKKHLFPNQGVVENKKDTKKKAFILVSMLTIILFGAVKLFIYDEILGSGWFSFGHLIEFQLGKFMIYSVFFIFGIYAYVNGWFTRAGGVGRVWLWGVGCYVLFGANMLVFKVLNSTDAPLFIYKVLHVILYPLWILSFLGLFLAIGYKYWNKATPFNRLMSRNSYNMYLIHYIFPMLLPLLLSYTAMPILVKFTIVAVTTLVLSFVLSEFILRKYPKSCLAGIILSAVLLGLLTNG